jgi:UDP-glucose 4-epimerase
VFGPRQDPSSQYAAVIPRFVTSMLDGAQPTVFGDGEQTRDFTYVDNVVDANVLAMNSTDGAGRAFNIAAGGRTSLNVLLRELAGITGKRAEPQYAPSRPGDVRDSYADTALAGQVLGYKPLVSVGEGLRRTVEWYSQRGTVQVGR